MFIDRFIRFITYEKRFSKHTVTAYSHELAAYIDYLETLETGVGDVTHRQARAYLAMRLESVLSPVSVHLGLAAVRTYYRFLMRESAARQKPFALVKALRTAKHLPVTVDREKLSTLLDSANSAPDDFAGVRDKTVLELLFGMGIRL